MNVSYLIGNGFDLNLGARTSYNDFYNYLKRVPVVNKDVIINEIRKFSNDNQDSHDINWSDFEAAIGEFSKIYLDTPDINKTDRIACFKSSFLELHRYFKDFINNENIKIESFIKENKKISEDIFNSLGNLDAPLESTDKLKFEILKPIFDRDINKATNSKTVYFIDFNYTHSLSNILTMNSNRSFTFKIGGTHYSYIINKSPLKIHGNCGRHIILGLDNVNQIASNLETSDMVDVLIKPIINEKLMNSSNSYFSKRLNSSDLYIIYGMSLGETDCRWWNLIMENLIKNENKILIIFDYLSSFQDYLITFGKTDQVKLKILAMYSKEIKPDLKSRLMSKQIYVVESSENLVKFNGKKMYEMERHMVN
ncbi:AbiH family protein [Sporolactobacillus terrae]|uniref:AbiH family protein n=1 Tax=Sporolactobacillus terrae TaxID=269673 RepID=UPI00111A8F0E|nr:AbiH family protein [Sporolactobacillus terrae]